MAIIDGQGCTFSFDGELVGRITRYNTIDGVTPDIRHKPMSKSTNFFLPGIAEFGSLSLFLYRDLKDPGQVRLEQSRLQTGKVFECIWTLSDGSTRTFTGYVKKLPIVGDDNGLGTADVVIKVAGALVSA